VAASDRIRTRLSVRGAVQGVGFRPFVYRLATDMGLSGSVINTPRGVVIDIEGPPVRVLSFPDRLRSELPAVARITDLESETLEPLGCNGFRIEHSEVEGVRTAQLLPDMATCPDCLAEVFDPSNRRYRYPFTNCTHCGPRFSIIKSLPYDRPNTTMSGFSMCPACLEEYGNPLDRRFHAQPNACPDCGPHLEWWDKRGRRLAERDDALLACADALREGKVVAVKGLGGFHLMADALNNDAVQLLRDRKHREEKPLAVMFPSFSDVEAVCDVDDIERELLTGWKAPIVLLPRALRGQLAFSVSCGNPNVGAMLPYTPLHHLLLRELGFPVVATSGNLADEPICIDEYEALQRLGGIADAFLMHNRPIQRHVDDSVVRVMAGGVTNLRRARGYAPAMLRVEAEPGNVLAVGAHLKNSVAVSVGRDVTLSQHIGDLETEQAFGAFSRVIDDFEAMYELTPEAVVCDLHPDYLSTQYAERRRDAVPVQHHAAHAYACIAENRAELPVLAVAWDGTGYGTDGTIWGGEFLLVGEDGWKRIGNMRPFPLPGGDLAVKEPRRSALGVLWEMVGSESLELSDLPTLAAFTGLELRVLKQQLESRINCPMTSSVGRLFDAAASIMGLRQTIRHEGMAAMALEFAAGRTSRAYRYLFDVSDDDFIVDWEPVFCSIADDVEEGVPLEWIAAAFHNTLARVIVSVAEEVGARRVALTGGCFQNRYLTERAVQCLTEAGIEPLWHHEVPPNDGGIAFGQIAAYAMDPRLRGEKG